MKIGKAVLVVVILGAVHCAFAQTMDIPNPSFELGDKAPDGWTLGSGKGEWKTGDAAAGRRTIVLSGEGDDISYWQTGPLAFEPGHLYCLRFRARTLTGTAAGPFAGPFFCNHDLGAVSNRWTEYRRYFVAPGKLPPDQAALRFGQWHLNGSVAFDDVSLMRAQPVYRHEAGLTFGKGESVQGNDYTFQAPFNLGCANQSRALESQNCYFNTNRWCFGVGSEVVYRHRVGDRMQLTATVKVRVGYCVNGAVEVEVKADDREWQSLGQTSGSGAKDFIIPSEVLPAREVRIRLRGVTDQTISKEGGTGALQVDGYEYHATPDGAPLRVLGDTWFVEVAATDPRFVVDIADLGSGTPGGNNTMTARVTNSTKEPVTVQPQLTLTAEGKRVVSAGRVTTVTPGGRTLKLPYSLSDAGEYRLALSFGKGSAFHAETSLRVPGLFASSYGQLLPASTEAVELWWAESGWKVSKTRPAPKSKGDAVLIRAARNEADAAQIVVRPRRALTCFVARGSDLVGPGGAKIPSDRVEVLRVRYVNITQPSNSTSAVAPWPDPLPPFKGPVSLAAGENQPLWVRVTAPRDAKPGLYRGVVRLTADGYHAEAPVRVQVYAFALPHRMTCTTAFGFDPGSVFRYQRITDPVQRREVLDKYLANLSAHHISPYDPAPLDPFKVTWPKVSQWQGGEWVREEKHAGEGCLRLVDESPTSCAMTQHTTQVAIAPAGIRLRFWFKTKDPEQRFDAWLSHLDASGQWMSGRNHVMPVVGNGTWQPFDQIITTFPEGAQSVCLSFTPAQWTEDGSKMGTVWLDEVSVSDVATGKELLRDDMEPPKIEDLKPQFDWSAWDAEMTRVMGRYHFNSFTVPIQGMGGGTFHSRYEPSLFGYGEKTPEYQSAFRSYCHEVQEHLRQKGWLDEAFVYWFDEPEPADYEFVSKGFRRLKDAAPDLNRMLTEQVEPQLVGGPNVWCPLTPAYNYDHAEERRKAGEKFWWYVCCGPAAPYCTMFTDHPATDLRVWLWQTWKYKVDGVLVWAVNYWTSNCAYPDPERPQNMYEDPMTWVSGYGTPIGVRLPWWNGTGHFIYPPEAAADAQQKETVLDGPVGSIRWEMLRDGIEDYEYHAMLERLIESKSSTLSKAELSRYRSLLEVPANVARDMTVFTKDPRPIEARRSEIARAIESLESK